MEVTLRSTLVSGWELEAIRYNAEECWLGGKSHVRTGDRVSHGPEDQFVGQLGEFALARFLGKPEVYFERRAEINKNPWMGDGGSDFPGAQIDVKTSLMRSRRSPMKYNLVVRPRERHEDNIYVFALVTKLDFVESKVVLVGYAHDRELPDTPDESGVFAGAYRMPCSMLRDIGGLREEISRTLL